MLIYITMSTYKVTMYMTFKVITYISTITLISDYLGLVSCDQPLTFDPRGLLTRQDVAEAIFGFVDVHLGIVGRRLRTLLFQASELLLQAPLRVLLQALRPETSGGVWWKLKRPYLLGCDFL